MEYNQIFYFSLLPFPSTSSLAGQTILLEFFLPHHLLFSPTAIALIHGHISDMNYSNTVWSMPTFPTSQPEMIEFSNYHELELATWNARWRKILRLNLGSVRKRTVLYEWWLSWAQQKAVTSTHIPNWTSLDKFFYSHVSDLSCSKINGSHYL